MMESNKGHIVSIASMASQCGIPKLVDYCASKYAVVGFDEALQMELEVGNRAVRRDALRTRFPMRHRSNIAATLQRNVTISVQSGVDQTTMMQRELGISVIKEQENPIRSAASS